jgi:lysophospholipase L1-like esterase
MASSIVNTENMSSILVNEYDKITWAISLNIWASSHASEHHGLPELLSDIMNDQSRYQAPVFDAKGGRKIDSGIVEVIKDDMTNRSGNPQVHVIILGTNNIRKGETPQLVFDYFSQIFQHCAGIPKAHVVFVGLLPSPKTDTTTKALFRETSKMLLDLTKSVPSKASFLNMATFFTRRGGQTIPKFYNDGIHFSLLGAKRYSEILWNHLRKLPNSNFQ